MSEKIFVKFTVKSLRVEHCITYGLSRSTGLHCSNRVRAQRMHARAIHLCDCLPFDLTCSMNSDSAHIVINELAFDPWLYRCKPIYSD